MNKAAEQAAAAAEDSALIKQYRDGSMEAFNVLYRRHLPGVFNRVRHVVPAEDVEDVTQEVFVAAARSLPKFRGESQFGTWLRSLTNHKVVEYYRRRGRKHESQVAPLDEETGRLETSEPGRTEDRVLVQTALQALPAPYREILLMRFAEDLSFQEIAKATGKNLEAAKSLFRRAVEALRNQLGEK